MFDPPKTTEEAKAYRYRQWAGSPKGSPYRIGHCAYEVWANRLPAQCERKCGHGPDELYCKQHAKKLPPRAVS